MTVTMVLPKYFAIRGTGLLPSLVRLYYFMLRVLYLELTAPEAFIFSFKRACIFATFFVLLPALMVWNHVGFYLDNILFPQWREELVENPLFFVGNARSGTTWLHRLITHDTERFTTFKTWEIVFAASITWRCLFFSVFHIDAVITSGLLYQFMMYIETKLVGNIHVHPIGLMQAEEDEWVMVHIGCAQLILFFFPMGGAVISDIMTFDYTAPTAERESSGMDPVAKRDIFGFYRQCVQRHLYFHQKLCSTSLGKNKLIFVSKNPIFTLRIPTIYDVFPDARVVCLLRNPVQSIPSMISYLSKVWHTFADPIDMYPSASALLGMCEAHYLFPLEHLNPYRKSECQWAFVSYHELLRDLEQTVVKLLTRLYAITTTSTGSSTTNTVLVRYLKDEQLQTGQFKSKHVHSIGQCCNGMTEEQLRQALHLVYEQHDSAFK